MPASAALSTAPHAPAGATPLLRLRDETFDAHQLAAYNLYLTVGGGRVRMAAIEKARQSFVLLEDHALPPGGLPALAAAHDCLGRAGWHAVRLATTGGAFTLLPAALFRPGDEAAALRLHHALAPAEAAYARPHPALELVNVFAADAALADWLAATHGPAGQLLHHTSGLLAGLAHQRDAGGPRRLYLSLGHHELALVVLGSQLEYCNVFAFATAEDVLYYTVLVMQELGLNPDQDELTVWGELTHDSALFTLLRNYVRHVRFGPRPYDLFYSYRFNEVFDHRYFDLFSLHFI
ncbi:DUF3822 family protein [Hymenobacter caeli]|uniref:DUF3822 family protein n=1 Tax=Hymenobacter caeli TaxID=2735894 RepID=A0ABX2FTX4_9BACT|nr:DUF3822 family protein [Hymenobacter caeli]NRT20650.1 hypothetical protein [Hymenobacter caeli]